MFEYISNRCPLLLLFSLLHIILLTISSASAQMPVIDRITFVPSTCDANNGELTIFATGTGTINYSIDNGNTFQTDRVFIDLPKGDYLIVVRDDVGLSARETIQLTNNNSPDPPTISCPAPLTIECITSESRDSIDNWLLETIALDSRLKSLSVNTETPIDSIDFSQCGTTIELTIFAEDDCNVSVSCMGSIDVIDLEMPEIVCPAEITIDIADSSWSVDAELWLEQVSALDNCNPMLTVENTFDIQDILMTCEEEFLYSVDFVTIDDCENIANCSSALFVLNELEPEVFCNAPLEFGCGEDPEELFDLLLIRFEELFAFDEDITVEDDLNYEDVVGLVCGEQVTLTFSVIDGACERMTQCSAEVTIVDSVIPEVDFCPENLTVTDLADAKDSIERWLETLAGSDNCSAINLSNDLDSLGVFNNLCGQTAPIPVSFIVSDTCGNINDSCNRILTIESQITSIICPTVLTLECGMDENVDLVTTWLSNATATSNSMDVSDMITNDFDADDFVESCDTMFVFNFEILDPCSTTQQCTGNILIRDSFSPNITCPNALEVTAGSENNTAIVEEWLDNISVSDNCSTVQLDMPTMDIDDITCGTTQTFEFVATDECGNISTCNADITVSDVFDVVLVCPDEMTFVCSGNITNEIRNELNLITEQNANLMITDDFEALSILSSCADEQEVIVTFEATDACNISSNCTTLLTILPVQELYIPNSISTRSENPVDRTFNVYGNQDFFNVRSLSIYDRWGGIIWQSSQVVINEFETGWDARSVESGVYVYLLEVDALNGETEIFSGSLTVFK